MVHAFTDNHDTPARRITYTRDSVAKHRFNFKLTM
jgi:hypothetical protein